MSKLNTSPPTSNVGISANASEPSTSRNDSGADVKFKCNICLELPVDAVVTRCGHLYCWECLHNWLERGAVQCPVCKAGVSRSDVVPVYGSESDHRPHPAVTAASESSSRCRSEEQPRQRIPERPRAERPEPPRSAAASSASATSQGWGAHNVQFGFFPFGFGVQFGTSGMMGSGMFGHRSTRSLTPEQQRSQFISTLLIMLGCFIIFWSILIDGVSSSSF